MITVISSSRYKCDKKKIREFAAHSLEDKNLADQSINIVFVGKTKMKSIASQYKNENIALPVLAFPYKEKGADGDFLGEIIICYPQAVLLAAERNKHVEPMLFELIEHAIKNLLK